MINRCKQIWLTVQAIPVGKVACYGQIADLAGLPGRARLVGTCLKQVPDDMPVPWHRVLRSDGAIAFPKGSDAWIRQTGLLQQEGVAVLKNKVKLSEFQWQPDLSELLHTLSF